MSFRPTRDRHRGFAFRDRRLAIEQCEDRVVLSATADVPTLKVDSGAFLYTLADSFALFDADGNRAGIIVEADAGFTRGVKASLSLGSSNGSLVHSPSSLANDINFNSGNYFKTILAPGASSAPEKGWIPLPVIQPERNLLAEGPNGLEMTAAAVQVRDEVLALPPSETERPRSQAVFFEVAATDARPTSGGSDVDAVGKSASTETRQQIQHTSSPSDIPKSSAPRAIDAALAEKAIASEDGPMSHLELSATFSRLPIESVSNPNSRELILAADNAKLPVASIPNIDLMQTAFAVQDNLQMDEAAAPITHHHQHYPEALAVALAALAAAEHHLSTRKSQQPGRKAEADLPSADENA